MEIEIVEESKTKMIFNFKTEDHTFVNPLKAELWNDENVKISAYRAGHPLVDTPELIVETNGKETPRQALMEAAKRMKKSFDGFKKAFEKEIK